MTRDNTTSSHHILYRPLRRGGVRSLLLALACCGVLLTLAEASASIRQPYRGRRPITLDAPIAGFEYLGFGGAFGARLGIPIVHNGFIPSINNAVYINFGLDVYWTSYKKAHGIALGIPITLHWSFYFNRRWSAFAELGVNVYFHGGLFRGEGFLFGPRWLMSAVGGRFHISRNFALILRLGFPYTSFGLSWSF